MIKAFYLGYEKSGVTANVAVLLKDNSGSDNAVFSVPLSISATDTDATIRAMVPGAVSAYCTTNGVTLDAAEWVLEPTVIPGLVNAPQAAISDSPADAVTNYNIVTTLLGALTGAVNAANTKQNAIATSLNTLLGELRTLGLIST